MKPSEPPDHGDEALPAPRLETDPMTGRPILAAPRRRLRPLHVGPSNRRCPFCAGHESDTPREIDAVREPGTSADGPGWRVRAFPNLFPACEPHYVIAEGGEHQAWPAALPAELWRDALVVWRRRVAAIERAGQHAFLFKNVGQRAGASVEHNHTQVLGLPMLPPRLALELDVARASPRCAICADLERARQDGRMVWRGTAHAVIAPAHPKLPHETWLVPLAHERDFDERSHADLAASLHAAFRAFANGLAQPPFNLWLHRIPGADFHWHFELQPRTGNLAGLELGGEMYINSVPPSESAATLRAAFG